MADVTLRMLAFDVAVESTGSNPVLIGELWMEVGGSWAMTSIHLELTEAQHRSLEEQIKRLQELVEPCMMREAKRTGLREHRVISR